MGFQTIYNAIHRRCYFVMEKSIFTYPKCNLRKLFKINVQNKTIDWFRNLLYKAIQCDQLIIQLQAVNTTKIDLL